MAAEPRPAPGRRSLWSGGAQVSLPARTTNAARELIRRALIAVGLLLLLTLIVYLDRDAYADHINDDGVSFVDALYYATVTMTTTGYGDITPVQPHSRLLNVFVVTPIRIAFLVLLVGTTVEVLANEGRRAILDARWRKKMRNHTVVIGYGTTGQSATATVLRNSPSPERIVVIDSDPQAVAAANRHGLAAFEGDATSRELLHRAELPKAKEVIITVGRDDTAILTTLTVRQINRGAHVVVVVRDADNLALIRQSGADAVVTSSDAVGRLMGLSSISPQLGEVIEDLLSSGEGLEVTQRRVTREEEGRFASEIPEEKVLAVIRNRTLRRYYEMGSDTLRTGDEVVVVRRAAGGQRTPRVE
jgi:voltage-gated potassium channel